MVNPVEIWKAEKHPLDVWGDVEHHASAGTPMSEIDNTDLERMKWHGFFYRKRDKPGRYMNRIRITANELSADQAREIALIAYEYGHGIVDVTTRANLQIQGLGIEHLPKVAKRLEQVGLTSRQTGHDNIRNVFGHPFSGLTDQELIDTRQLCRDIDALYLNDREFSDLPRKLNICFNGTEHHPAHFWTQDLSFLAARSDDGRLGFQVLLGGTQGQNPRLAWHLPVFLNEWQVAPLTRAIIELFRTKGSREKRNRARLRFLVEEIGISGVLDWLDETLPFRCEPSIRPPVPTSAEEQFVGWFRQGNSDLWCMGLSVPLGRMTWHQLESLALLSRRWGNGELRTTQEQGIAVVNIPTGFKGAAATAAAAAGLSIHADDLELNTLACTGSQFCNIAVTETKGHMLQLIQQLRQRALKLHGIRIHMSGCPSSCAQHFTADIGLKGVRVRRLLGTREGFDVFLGGGIAGQVHMGLPYKLGVDVDQLPTLIEEVTSEYYLKHQLGQTFSVYWRERLQAQEARKVGNDDYVVPRWICEACDHLHRGEDPPVFCPACAGLRRNFARLEDGSEPSESESQKAVASATEPTPPEDGFAFAVKLRDVPEQNGVACTIHGREYALFRHDGGIKCIDGLCPHEGASLVDGTLTNGVVACPWHDWKFNVCNGCSIEPPGNDVKSYETLTVDGNIFVRTNPADQPDGPQGISGGPPVATPRPGRPVDAVLPLLEVIEETHDVRTFRLDNSEKAIPFAFPGQFARVCVEAAGEEQWRSFTISSSPVQTEKLDLTIKRNPSGLVTNELFQTLKPPCSLRIKAAQGGFYFDPEQHKEPLILISAGSGITPMMSIARFVRDTGLMRKITFLYGARTASDIIFHDECRTLAETCDWFQYFLTLSDPPGDWSGPQGRLSMDNVRSLVQDLPQNRYFLCGPESFMDAFQQALQEAGVPPQQIHTEAFHASSPGKLLAAGSPGS